MNPYVTSKDPAWHRAVDGLVILAIGFVIGIIVAGSLLTYETTTVKTIRRVPTLQAPSDDAAGTVESPQNNVKINEI
ncbi:MAG: hypothetical protein WAQ57_02185 [Candidatus Saccharimonadales bacterium]